MRTALAAVLLVAAAFAMAAGTVGDGQPQPWATAAGDELPQAALLAVTVLELRPAPAPEGEEETAALRRAEARYVPYLLRSVIERTRAWGPARVLPRAEAGAELLVGGEILESTPRRLVLHVIATDSTGRTWLDREYPAEAALSDYPTEPSGDDPFLPLYRQVATDLASVRAGLSLEALQRIIDIARLRYAAALAPGVFDDYTATDGDGRVRLRRLPAEDDPMMARVARVREAEYLFVDVLDRHYRDYHETIGPTYIAWRKARLDATALMADYRSRAAGRSGRDHRPLHRRYGQFTELKQFERTLREQLEAFAFESGPTTLELKGELVELTGSLAAQYDEWQRLLREIHQTEVGLD